MSRLEDITRAWNARTEEERELMRGEWLERMKTDPAFALTADVLMSLHEENEQLRETLKGRFTDPDGHVVYRLVEDAEEEGRFYVLRVGSTKKAMFGEGPWVPDEL